MQGTMPGARRRGKPRTTWMENKTRTGLLLEESIRKTEDKTGPRIEDGQRTEQIHIAKLVILLPVSY